MSSLSVSQPESTGGVFKFQRVQQKPDIKIMAEDEGNVHLSLLHKQSINGLMGG